MKKKNRKFGIAVGLLILSGVCIAAALLLYFPAKVRATFSRPLVLVHAPLNRQQISLGEYTLVNATARNAQGVQRVELWVDDAFYFAQEAAPGSAPSSLALMVPWEPLGAGRHTLVVRAISSNEVAGQASVRVWAEEAQHTLEEGETLETIADKYGISVEALLDANPDMAAEGPAVDEVIDIPSGGSSPGAGAPPSGGAPAPPADEPPPAPADSPPGDAADVIEELGVDLPDPADELSPDPVSVKVEALALQSGAAYESLHCYASMGHLEPQWYPDADHDQTTDESFASLGGADWDVAAHLGGDHAPVFTWAGNEPMPFDITCVGITGGGTDSVNLGRVEILAEPGTWDGVIRRAGSIGGEGRFELEYRIERRGGGMGFPLILDPSIPPPTNLRTEGFFEMHWDWEPDPEDEAPEPIDGFYVYVNNTLQFTIYDPEARSIFLPPEWFTPPCGLDYNITMTAWRWNPDDHTDNYESYPSEPLVFTRDALEECDIRAYVTFETLTITGAIDDEGRTDSLGPVNLVFNAISQGDGHLLNLDTWCDRADPACEGLRLEPAHEYDIGFLMRLGDQPNYVRVPLTADGLSLQFVIYDQSSVGSGLWCAGHLDIPGEEIYNPDGETDYTGSMVSLTPDERCQMTFSIRTELLASYREDIGYPPLPQLGIEDILTEGNNYWINVHNYSSGTWAYDLEVLMERNSGEEIGYFTLPDFVLLPGAEANIVHPEMPTIERPGDLCVTLDPQNTVLESVERDNPGWTSGPFCIAAPDLVITHAGFAADDRTLVVIIRNRGDAPVTPGMRAGLEVIRRDTGGSEFYSGYLGDDGLHPWESVAIELPVLDNAIRSYGLRTNFSVVVDPADMIVESDENNNEFDLSSNFQRVRLDWWGFDFSTLEEHIGGYTYNGLSVTYYPAEDEHNYDYFHVRAYVENGVERRLIAQFDSACNVPRGILYGGYQHDCLGYLGYNEYTSTFALATGEWVTVSISGDLYADDAELSGSTRGHHDLGEMWLEFPRFEVGHLPPCEERYPMGLTRWGYVYPPEFDIGLYPWYAGLTLCSMSD